MRILEITELEWENVLNQLDYNNYFQRPDFLNLTAKYFSLKNKYFQITKDDKKLYFSLQENEKRIGFSSFIGYGGMFPTELFSLDQYIELKDTIKSKFNILIERIKIFPTLAHLNNQAELKNNFYTAILPIYDTLQIQENHMHKKTRTAVRYALKHDVIVKRLSRHNMEDFYSIYLETMKRVKSEYLTPKNFFYDLLNMENTILLGAFINKQLIAASVFLFHKTGMFYWWNASNQIGKKFSANYAILYNAVSFCINNHFSFLDMASSHSNEIERTKLRWGAKQIPLHIIK